MVMKIKPFLLAALLAVLAGCSEGASTTITYPAAPPDYPLYSVAGINNEAAWKISNTHDPSIFKDGGRYYVFSTDYKVGGKARPGIMVRSSPDLIQWEWQGYALDGVPKAAAEWSKAEGLWAPDIVKLGDTYYLYYAASRFGTNRSFIGVATSASINGPWKDQGEVLKTMRGSESNAIDPNIVMDADGEPWLAYGSFFGGIYISKLDPGTGKLKEYGKGKLIARRSASKSGAVEGPYIVYQPELKKYYLFVSYDSLSPNYNVRVGRSDTITGPYVDYNGHPLADPYSAPAGEIGTKILNGYRFAGSPGWIAPGHNSVLNDGGQWFMVHHARGGRDKNWSYLQVRRMLWTEDGWPVVSPERYAGEKEQSIPKNSIPGEWERIELLPLGDNPIASRPLLLEKEGTIKQDNRKGRWTFDGKRTMTLHWEAAAGGTEPLNGGDSETVLLLPSWDWELNRTTIVFTGLSRDGVSVWGKKVLEKSGN